MGQMALRDFTVAKVMLTAIIVGGVGVWIMKEAGLIKGLHIKPALLLANALGGAIFGVGMVLAGYCPGTSFAAIGQGSLDAIAATGGMIVGAGLFAQAYPWLSREILAVGDYGKITLPDLTGIPWWTYFTFLAVGGLLALTVARRGRCERGTCVFERFRRG
jgi:uncharacterized membrane protein YedE/YeeE